ncbi:unnamed protein product [Darwinula stevensoni]|uniref:Uncharacterized protein n=1 Tax=Darwinula stevensoni TaxID=69355 RepID=A0A7R9ACW0_9CRUS|nr:unnamed protein product [Darwinula stevensoni]CAG0900418.1 unnamed protein product [Darwinula stevensoni]
MSADMKMSMALMYETGGREAWDFACWVDRVRRDVTPKVTRAGAASGFIQKDTHFGRKRDLLRAGFVFLALMEYALVNVLLGDGSDSSRALQSGSPPPLQRGCFKSGWSMRLHNSVHQRETDEDSGMPLPAPPPPTPGRSGRLPQHHHHHHHHLHLHHRHIQDDEHFPQHQGSFRAHQLASPAPSLSPSMAPSLVPSQAPSGLAALRRRRAINVDRFSRLEHMRIHF